MRGLPTLPRFVARCETNACVHPKVMCESIQRLSILSRRRALVESPATDNSKLSGRLRSRKNRFPTLPREQQSSGEPTFTTCTLVGETNGKLHQKIETQYLTYRRHQPTINVSSAIPMAVIENLIERGLDLFAILTHGVFVIHNIIHHHR